jgi:hypothetical protein
MMQPGQTVAEPLRHTVAFRLRTTEYLDLIPFFEAFGGSGSAAFRWLLSQEETKAAIQRAVEAANA